MLLGALDLGSNSFHLLVARADGRGRLSKVAGGKATIRLEEAVAATGRIQPETFARALEAVGELVAIARRHETEHLVLAGTSALREADNGRVFATAVRARYRLDVEILSGEDEGRLVYHGARSRLEELPDRVGVLDLGGGSAELAVGDCERCLYSVSLPLGFLRLARALDAHGVLDAAKRERVKAHVDATAEPAKGELARLAPRAWLLSGGTARALSGVTGLELGAAVSTRQLSLWAERYAACDPSRLVGLGVRPARARGFGVGVLALAALAESLGAPAVRITPGGLREGLILRELAPGSGTSRRAHVATAGRLMGPAA